MKRKENDYSKTDRITDKDTKIIKENSFFKQCTQLGAQIRSETY